MKQYTKEEISLHKNKQDCWIIIRNKVYDITSFLNIHPGGSGILMTVGGKDATEYFEELHKEEILTKIGETYMIGLVQSSKL